MTSPTAPDLGAVFEASPNAYMVLDRELRYVAANAAYRAATGTSHEALLGAGLFELFPHDPDDPNNESARVLRASLERVLRTGEPDAIPFIRYRVPSGEGGERDAFWSATHTPLFDDDGAPAFVLQHTMNVTRLREAGLEREVVQTAQMVQQAFRVLDEGQEVSQLLRQSPAFMAFLRGPEHRFVRVNDAYQRLIGDRPVLGLALRDALPEVVGQGFVDILDEVYRSEEPYVGRGVRVMLANVAGEPPGEHYVDFVYQPIVDESDRVTGVFVHGNDVTERERALSVAKQAQQEAEEASRLKDEFLATVSHELRTPLNAILGWAQVALEDLHDRAQVERALKTIERNADAQAQVIEDLLDVSRIVAGTLRMSVETLDLAQPVAAAVETVRPAARAKEIRIHDLLQSSVGVIGDPQRLQQIVWNLVSNAVKFTPRGGRVEVVVRKDGSEAVVSVADNGPGIPDDFLPVLFDRFRQASQGTERRAGGLGLGLAIVRHLTEAHGGRVSAANRAAGGAVFEVRLPLSLTATGAPAREEAAQERPDLTGLRVMVVDDEPDARGYVSVVLQGANAEVVTAASAADALARIGEARPDVIVSDIGMPDVDGYAFIAEVRRLPPDRGGRAPALALTAYARPEDRARALLAGFQNHVSKPVGALELLAAVAAIARW